MVNKELLKDIELEIINDILRLYDMGIFDGEQCMDIIMTLLWHSKSSVFESRFNSYFRVAESKLKGEKRDGNQEGCRTDCT